MKTKIIRVPQKDDVSLSQFCRRRRPFAVDAAIGVSAVEEWRQRGTAPVVGEEAMKRANAIAGYGNILGGQVDGRKNISSNVDSGGRCTGRAIFLP